MSLNINNLMNPMDRIKDVYHVKTTPAITANYLHFFPIFQPIIKTNFDNFFISNNKKYSQKELPLKHETDHDGLLNRAFAVKYNPKKMKKLEKDFSILKKEEQEEQIEMRRLRAENKLLKQRIDNLEKVSQIF